MPGIDNNVSGRERKHRSGEGIRARTLNDNSDELSSSDLAQILISCIAVPGVL